MTSYVWKDFPEINRSVAFVAGYNSAGLALGCHCGTITSVTAHLGIPISTTPTNIPNVRIIKATADDPKVETETLTRGMYSGYTAITQKEMDKINTHMLEKKFSFDNFGPEFGDALASYCSHTPIWVLSDVINYNAPARHSGVAGSSIKPGIPQLGLDRPTEYFIAHTSMFADYLVQNNLGYVFESPVVQNPAHKLWGGYSLNRVWVWIPSQHLNRSLGCMHQYGQDKFPNIEEWKKIVFTDLSESSKTVGSYVQKPMDPEITEETVFQAVFDGGIFPDSNRFKQRLKEA